MILNGKMINPGELNKRVTLLRREMVKKPGGAQRQDAVPIDQVWARWRNVHGAESWSADAAQAQRAGTVLIRYRADVDETCLVQKGDDVFEIISIDNIEERNEYLELKVRLAVEA